MTTVLIVPETQNGKGFRAVAGEKESFGQTMGEALDALAATLDESHDQVVLLQDFRPDEFFTEDQQRRLSFLMTRWRAARDAGQEFSAIEQNELEYLIETELAGSAKRAERLMEQIER